MRYHIMKVMYDVVVVLYLNRRFFVSPMCNQSKPMSQHNSVELLDSIEKKLFGGEKNELQLKTVSVGVFSKVYRLNFKGSDVRSSTAITLPIDNCSSLLFFL